MYYQEEAEKKERRKIIAVATIAVIFILLLIIAIIVVATKKSAKTNVSGNENSAFVVSKDGDKNSESSSEKRPLAKTRPKTPRVLLLLAVAPPRPIALVALTRPQGALLLLPLLPL